MSIIYDALKKVQNQFPMPNSVKNKNNIWLWLSIGSITLGFLGCGFVLMLLINSSSQKTVIKNIKPENNKPTETLKAINLPQISKQTSSNTLVLNGIISMEGEYLALINNQILKEGDYIQDMRILSITKERVELYSKGKITILTQK
ncbi:MAG: hypothetical protein Q8O13_02245 [Candidatus Omnitrophota bacterium]|nr:hypothetical protein [Candidatus Omnitrophota bacterium]